MRRKAQPGTRPSRTGATLHTDPGARYDRVVEIDAASFAPYVTWGTNPGMVVPVTGEVPDPAAAQTDADRGAAERALEYMALAPAHADREHQGGPRVHRLVHQLAPRRPARRREESIKGHHVNPKVRAMVVPGSQAVKREAEHEGLDRIFTAAGFEWRESGCSMCLAMNPDVLQPGERCASTSNRNFEGRQGRGGRTHLVSPDDGRRRRHRPATSPTSATGEFQ